MGSGNIAVSDRGELWLHVSHNSPRAATTASDEMERASPIAPLRMEWATPGASKRARARMRKRICKPGDQRGARLEFGDLTAEGKLDERHSGDALRLDSYFGALAEDWRGSEGERTPRRCTLSSHRS